MNLSNQETIAVVVPVYEAENYLHECLDSIGLQSYEAFVLYLVDDGTLDSCGLMCDEYANTDQRVISVHKSNGGQSSAFNCGICLACEQYIALIDDDDVVHPLYLEMLYKALVCFDVDVSVCSHKSFVGDVPRDESLVHTLDLVSVISGHDACYQTYLLQSGVSVFPWGKLYRRSLFFDKLFPLGVVFEDQHLIPRLLLDTRGVSVLDDILYYYRQNETSIMHAEFSVRDYGDIESVSFCRALYETRGLRDLCEISAEYIRFLEAKLFIKASAAGKRELIPPQHYVGEIRALYRIRKYGDDNIYTYWLSQVHPRWLLPHAYLRKVASIFGFRKN